MAVDIKDSARKHGLNLIALALAVPFGVAFFFLFRWASFYLLSQGIAFWQTLTTIFLSIIIEAVPFILLGVFASALIQVFVSEDTIAKFVPKSRFLGIVLASLMGIIFPVCECGIVPVARRLISKGVPASMGVSFLLAVPIINPVVMASTYFAFGNFRVAALRAAAALVVSILVALLLAKSVKENPLSHHGDSCHDHDHACGCSCAHEHHEKETALQKVYETLSHASDEFFHMGKYLIIGAFLAAVLQVVVSREVLLSVGQSPIPATASMMGLAYGLSLCSEADAFIAATFVQSFSLSSILAFLVFGPMLDIKNTLMLLSTFKAQFVFRLIAAVTLIVFVLSLILHYVL